MHNCSNYRYSSKKRSLFLFLYILILFFMLICGLWPFNFVPHNNITLIPSSKSIHFGYPSITYIKACKKGSQELSTPITLEMKLYSSKKVTSHVPQIFGIGNDREDLISLGQWKNGLIIIVLDEQHKVNKLFNNEVFSSKDTVLVTLCIDTLKMSLFINGELENTCPLKNPLHAFQYKYMTFGNSVSGRMQWTGDICGIAIYKKCFTSLEASRSAFFWKDSDFMKLKNSDSIVQLYSFNIHADNLPNLISNADLSLKIPSIFSPPVKNYLTPFWKDFNIDKSYLVDAILNLFGFIPSGFLLGILLPNKLQRKKIFFIVAIVSFFLSFSIETLQIFLPSRTSQMSDLILNTLGGVLGAFLLSDNLKVDKSNA